MQTKKGLPGKQNEQKKSSVWVFFGNESCGPSGGKEDRGGGSKSLAEGQGVANQKRGGSELPSLWGTKEFGVKKSKKKEGKNRCGREREKGKSKERTATSRTKN